MAIYRKDLIRARRFVEQESGKITVPTLAALDIYVAIIEDQTDRIEWYKKRLGTGGVLWWLLFGKPVHVTEETNGELKGLLADMREFSDEQKKPPPQSVDVSRQKPPGKS